MTDRATVLDSLATLVRTSPSRAIRPKPCLWLMFSLLIAAFPHNAEGRGSCNAGRVVPQHGPYPTQIIHGGSIPGFLTPPITYQDTFYRIGQPTFQPLIPQRVSPRSAECYPATCPAPPIIIIQQPAAPVPPLPVTPPPVVSPAVSRQLEPARSAVVPRANPNARDTSASAPGQVYFWIQQPEADVVLDGESLGTGADIDDLDGPIELSAGVHVLVTEHPDFGSERLVFSVPSGKEILVEINLSGNRSGRKARVRSGPEIAARLPFFKH